MIKQIVSFMRHGLRAVAVSAICMASTTMLWAQDTNEKFSLTTQIFLNDLKEQASQPQNSPRHAPRRQQSPSIGQKHKARGLIVSPDTIDGIAYISCFIHLKDAGSLDQVNTLGVRVQKTFDGLDFVTALVPVNELEALAEIDNVTKIKVAQQMRPLTDAARQKTNADDVLTQSSDAINAGVTSKFDGTGVVLGIIDTGIDFQHIAFKDKDGNSRIRQAYVYDGSSTNAQRYSSITSDEPTTDDEYEDHGTHTASTAGGSSVVASGTTVSVTDNHASATYGGMAPGADLYLAGINGLSDSHIATALQEMVTYADEQGKPLVVSNSWGSGWGPRDGTGEFATLVAKHFGDDHPNHIILFASSNDAGRGTATEGGGFFVKKSSATSTSPLGTIIRTEGEGGDYYGGLIACAWNASNAQKLYCKLHVLDNSTGSIKRTWTVTNSQTSFYDLSTYYSGSMAVYIEQEGGKYRLAVYSNSNKPLLTKGDYTLAIEVYPSSGSADINMWAGDWTYFTSHLTTSNHTWTSGTDDMCVSDEATIPDAISVGAYVSKSSVKNYQGYYYSYSSGSLGDIADFSSFATTELSATGEAYPWITAPGAQVVAGVNHYHTASIDDYSYFYSDNKPSLAVNNSSNPYGVMQGTSMATPVASGIVALWLQAAQSVGKELTVNDVKEIMAQTAIQDSYTTTGANASHFGNGKIDALAGIQYILATSSSPHITASAASVNFTASYTPELSQTETITVSGANLTEDITVSLDDESGAFSVNTTSIPVSTAADGTDIIVTWTPTAIGETTATLTLSSSGAEDVVISLTGTVSLTQSYALVTDASILQAGDKILIAYINGDDKYVLSTTQQSNNRKATDDVRLNADGTLTPGDAAQVVTLEKHGDNFLLNVGTGYLYAASSGSNYLRTNAAIDANGNSEALISIDGGDATIKFQGTYTRNLLGFNKTNNPRLFSCYKGTSNSVALPQIYREAPIALSSNGTVNTDLINALDGKKANVALADRTLYKDGAWNTICLPFSVPVADSPLAGADVRALNSASLDGETLTLNFTGEGEVTTIAAGTPYIIKWASGNDITNPEFKDVTMSSSTNGFTSSDGKVRFTGTYNFISFDAEDKSILFMGETNALNYPLGGARIGAFRSYFQLEGDFYVKQSVLNFGDTPDAIPALPSASDEKPGVWYDLSGRRLPGKPALKGIYILNGTKKVM